MVLPSPYQKRKFAYVEKNSSPEKEDESLKASLEYLFAGFDLKKSILKFGLYALIAIAIFFVLGQFLKTNVITPEFMDETINFLKSVGPVGLFFGVLIANASLFLPLPTNFVIASFATIDMFGMGVWSPLLIGILAGVAGTLGEFSGYVVGYLGRTLMKNQVHRSYKMIDWLSKRLDKQGIPLIAIFSFAPLPFDAMGIAAGLANYSKTKFFIGCALGKTPKYILFTYAGYFGIPVLIKFFAG